MMVSFNDFKTMRLGSAQDLNKSGCTNSSITRPPHHRHMSKTKPISVRMTSGKRSILSKLIEMDEQQVHEPSDR